MTRDPTRSVSSADASYGHLRIPDKPGYVLTNRGWESGARYRLRKLMADFAPLKHAVQGAGRLGARVSAIAAYLTSLTDEEAANRKFCDLLAKDAATANEPGSGYGSADAVDEFVTTLAYARIFEADPALDRSGTHDTARCVEATVASVAASDPSLRSCLNFGVSYGRADARLAARFPNMEFVGLDRSPLTKVLNELVHPAPAAGNLKFVADDIFHALGQRAWARSAFLHCRTLVQLPMSFIERLYAAVHAAGFEYVLGFEPVGLSRVSKASFGFSDSRKSSELFRDNLFLHNYPGLLAAAGYAVQRSDLVRTSHPHEDYRILYFVAKRNPA